MNPKLASAIENQFQTHTWKEIRAKGPTVLRPVLQISTGHFFPSEYPVLVMERLFWWVVRGQIQESQQRNDSSPQVTKGRNTTDVPTQLAMQS